VLSSWPPPPSLQTTRGLVARDPSDVQEGPLHAEPCRQWRAILADRLAEEPAPRQGWGPQGGGLWS
jgi:hypothetical protein